MHSFLLIGTDLPLVLQKAEKICEDFGIHTFDKTILESQSSIGIQDIRNMQKNILFSPLKGKMKALIITNADSMTRDSQNAFLKTLEEPPHDTIILLLAQNKEAFLPTIISRCTILQVPSPPKKTEAIDISLIIDLQTFSLSEKLYHAQSIAKTKETAINWCEATITQLRLLLHQNPTLPIVTKLQALSKTYKNLKTTNANTRILIEHLLLDTN